MNKDGYYTWNNGSLRYVAIRLDALLPDDVTDLISRLNKIDHILAYHVEQTGDHLQALRNIQELLPKLNLPAQDMASFFVMETITRLVKDALEGVKE